MSVEKLDIKHVRQAQKSFTTHLNQVMQNIPDAFILGVYCYLSSLPHDWVVNKQHLMKHFKSGRDKIENTMAWLNKHSLIEYQQERTFEGKMGKSLIIVKDGNDFINNFVINQQHPTAPLKNRLADLPLSGETATTYINIKDIKEIKDKNNNIVFPEWLNTSTWDDFKQHRKELKKPLSPLAEKKALNLLTKLRMMGNDPESVINTSIVNGWSGLFEIKKTYIEEKKYKSNIEPIPSRYASMRDFTQERLEKESNGPRRIN